MTHPDVTRYFMTISEACQLVLQASCIGKDGEVMILDMGEPIKILDVAKTLIENSGNTDLQIVFTGLREGEKMHEELFGSREKCNEKRRHRLLSHAVVPALDLHPIADQGRRFSHHGEAFNFMRETALEAVSNRQTQFGLPTQRTDEQTGFLSIT